VEQKTESVSEYLSTVPSGNVSVMFLDDSVDPVVLCDKHPEFTEVQIVDSRYKGTEIVDLYLKMKPDAVFVNLQKAQNDCIYALGKIRELNCGAKIIAF